MPTRRHLLEANADLRSLLESTSFALRDIGQEVGAQFNVQPSAMPQPVLEKSRSHQDRSTVSSIGRDESAQPKGLACRVCGCRHLRCLETRQATGNRIFRRKVCRHCGAKLSTFEKP
jgi:hypothetical protein